MKFIDEHYEKGELYTEFVRVRCQTTSSDKTKCNFCTSGAHDNTPEIHGIPQPKPNKSKLPGFHYLNIFETPLYKDEDGNTRPPDENQPRTTIRRQFENGSLSLNNQESFDTFCHEYIVDERHTRAYLEHLLHLKRVSEIGKRDREVQKEVQIGKKYSDYNWDKLATSVNSLLKLKVSKLDKYQEYHKLPKNGKKGDKVLQILAHKLQDDLPE